MYSTIIDTEDLERLKEENLKWHVKYAQNTRTFYAKATKYLGTVNGKAK